MQPLMNQFLWKGRIQENGSLIPIPWNMVTLQKVFGELGILILEYQSKAFHVYLIGPLSQNCWCAKILSGKYMRGKKITNCSSKSIDSPSWKMLMGYKDIIDTNGRWVVGK